MQDRPAAYPGIKKSRARADDGPVRVLFADDDGLLHQRFASRLAERTPALTALSAGDVPSAVEALLVHHPALVVADVRLKGHAYGGLRLVLDAVSIGIPVIAVGRPISEPVRRRLRELGATWIESSMGDEAVLSAVDRALGTAPSMPRQDRSDGQLGVARA